MSEMESINISEFRGLSEKEAEKCLSDCSVSDVKIVLDAVIADKSMRKKQRRKIVSQIVENQPHPTKEFERYNKWNSKLTEIVTPVDVSVYIVSVVIPATLISSGVAFSLFSSDPLTFRVFLEGLPSSEMRSWFVPLFLVGIGIISAAFFALGTVHEIMSYRKRLEEQHDWYYQRRAEMSIQEFRTYEEERKKAHREERIRKEKRQLAELTEKFSGDNAEVSLVDAKQDFADAQSRIASYETDIDKALKYPAFNDVTVPQVSDMIIQLRKCRRQHDRIASGGSVDHTALSAFVDAVDELWVRIAAAEETAKKLGWSKRSVAEQKDLKRAQDLLAHINDATYSEQVRTNFFSQLKQVVDRLNRERDIVPVKIVGEIEAKSRKEIESMPVGHSAEKLKSPAS